MIVSVILLNFRSIIHLLKPIVMNRETKLECRDEKVRQILFIDDKPVYEVGGFITKNDAREFHQRYLKYKYDKEPDIKHIKGHLIGKGTLLKLLGQPDCHGVRVYYGLKKTENGLESDIMFVGVYKDGNNMVDRTIIADMTYPCPTICPDDDDVF